MSQAPREFEGKDLEDALRAAAAALGASADSLDFKVLEEGRRGVFGLGARSVRIVVQSPQAAAPTARSPESPREESPSIVEAPGLALERILSLMGLALTAQSTRQGDVCRIELDGPDRDSLTKNDGELLAALQFILNRMGRRAWPEVGHVQLHCSGFPDEHGESVAELAREVASVVARTGLARKLQPMNPFERRLVHVTVAEFPGLTTRSEGEGFLKRVVVERGASRSPKHEG